MHRPALIWRDEEQIPSDQRGFDADRRAKLPLTSPNATLPRYFGDGRNGSSDTKSLSLTNVHDAETPAIR